ncbi:MAG TPA: serine hydrolase, partial [Bacteroidota bacterium]|nr:serine hydrolase [Bacteroidota bacterium]
NAYICSYSDAEALTEATVEALFGEIPTKGKLPITIPDMFAYGTGVEIPQSMVRIDAPESAGFNRDSLYVLDSIVTRAIRDGAFPGAQLLVAKDGSIVYDRSFGRYEYSTASSVVTNSTMYDLASLTKVVATTSAVMKLYEEGRLGFEDKITKFIPEFGVKGKQNVFVRNLLLHNGGLPAFKRLYLTCKSPQEVLDSVYATELIYQPGDSTVYSDFDFILLGKIIEKISGQPLDQYVGHSFFEPLGMSHTMYVPPALLLDHCAPTEYDSVFRKTLVQGVVHDENAYALGGVSGHAGLFSTASDLAILMQMLMNGGSYGGKQFLKPETIHLFTSKQTGQSTRALGWDTKTMTGYSTAGSLFSEKSFGHTGFTGTSIWADPTRNVFVIFLTNRVYPTRTNTKIASIRPLVHDQVIRALISQAQSSK